MKFLLSFLNFYLVSFHYIFNCSANLIKAISVLLPFSLFSGSSSLASKYAVEFTAIPSPIRDSNSFAPSASL